MDNFGPPKAVHDETISSLHSSDAGEGKKMGECFFYKLFTGWDIATVHDPGYITLNFHEVISNMCEKKLKHVQSNFYQAGSLEEGACDCV